MKLKALSTTLKGPSLPHYFYYSAAYCGTELVRVSSASCIQQTFPAVCVHVNNVTGDRRKLENQLQTRLCCTVRPTGLDLLTISNMQTSYDTAACAHSNQHVPLSSRNSFINIISNCPVHGKSIDADQKQYAGSVTVHHHQFILLQFTQSHRTNTAEYRCSCAVHAASTSE